MPNFPMVITTNSSTIDRLGEGAITDALGNTLKPGAHVIACARFPAELASTAAEAKPQVASPSR